MMLKYIGKRLLFAIPVILCVAIMIFTLLYFVPGDPAAIILGAMSTQEERQALDESMGLHDPYTVQLGRFLKDTFIHLDLGDSYISKSPVMIEIINRIPYTLKLCYIGILIAVLVGIPLGVIAAVYHNSWLDNLAMLGVIFGVSMPNFWFALVMILWFSLGLKILPVTGVSSWTGYIIPCISVAIGSMSMFARQMRSSMLEALREDYITTARAKGQREWKIVIWHALKNAMIPVITSVGAVMASTMGCTVVIETIFSIPGIGSYLVDGINNRDYPVVRGTVLVLAIVFTLMMLLVDILYAAVDPRMSDELTKTKKKHENSKGVA